MHDAFAGQLGPPEHVKPDYMNFEVLAVVNPLKYLVMPLWEWMAKIIATWN
jgi:hypothetical protein